MSRMWIFCLIVDGDAIDNLLCFWAFSIVMNFWMIHFSEEARWIPRYVYDSFCLRVGKGLFLKWICCPYMYALKVLGFRSDCLGIL